MSALAPTLEAWFTDRLIGQRQASPNTVAAYRDGWRLLLQFVQSRTGTQPSRLDIGDLNAEVIGDFLTHLEQERHNSVRTRNARLAAIRSFFRYAALRHPEHAALIARVLEIPTKRGDRQGSLASSTLTRWTPCWPLPTQTRGPEGETRLCSTSPCRPD